ncbi:GNAT family N-acetyltransferase [Paenibacillus cymbidii]|uniref:GNAT family N-acetyltransferase n=1 Tax=Paenibacillus cymbidii TaxID=1639034 RepID=UPI0010810456|nr:GNAT family N-acetyltransferase [Paenibacillus cymbidii]
MTGELAIQVRPVARDDWAQAIRLVNEVFREEGERTMEIAFARSFSDSLGQSIGAFAGDRIVGFMGLVPSVMRIGPAFVSVYQLGQVCTHPEWQGRGVANRMMEAAIARIEEAGASLLFVSGARSLYARHRCLRYGGMVKAALGRESAERLGRLTDSEEVVLRERVAADWFRLHELDRGTAVRFERSIWDLADLIASEAFASGERQRHRVYVAERDGDLLACIVVRVARDRERGNRMGLVEWAGDTERVAALVGYAMKLHAAEACEVPFGWQEEALRRQLEAAACIGDSQRMPGTIRVIDSARLLEQLEPFYLAQGAVGRLKLVQTWQDGSVTIGWTKGIGKGARAPGESEDGSEGLATLSAQQWSDWLFSPAESELDAVLRELEARWGRIPVPLPYPGGLNYV